MGVKEIISVLLGPIIFIAIIITIVLVLWVIARLLNIDLSLYITLFTTTVLVFSVVVGGLFLFGLIAIAMNTLK